MERRRPRRPPAHPLVLVVDGDPDTRDLYAEALRFFGFEIETVDDVADAYARARETHPDVIATEIPLSTDTGWKFMQDLKRDPRTRDIPVVVVTSQGQACVRARAEQEACAAAGQQIVNANPNLAISLPGGIAVIVNEQTSSGDGGNTAQTTVNALHITAPGVDVVVGSSHSDITCP